MAKIKIQPDWVKPAVFNIKHPEIAKYWNEKFLGYLLWLRLVHGVHHKRTTYISEPEVLNLWNKYASAIAVKSVGRPEKVDTSDFITPTCFFAKYPGIRNFWDERCLGYLLMLSLVHGTHKGRICLVSEKEALHLYQRYVCGIEQ